MTEGDSKYSSDSTMGELSNNSSSEEIDLEAEGNLLGALALTRIGVAGAGGGVGGLEGMSSFPLQFNRKSLVKCCVVLAVLWAMSA